MPHRARSPRSSAKQIVTGGLLAGLVALGAPMPRAAFAGPEGAKVVRGDVKVEKVGDKTTIHASDRSIIKFKNFDIAPNETVQFVQPDAKSSVLNKINGAKPTKIEGALLANGRVYLVNKSGVYFAPGAEIRVAEIVAAAGHISNRDFLEGIDRFSNVTGSVRNDGSIHAQAAKLVGANVSNSGFISAEDAIVMVSGNDVLLGKRGSRLYVKIGTTAPSDPSAPGVAQSGTLEAEGGQVLLAGGDMLGMAIEHSGTTRADRIALRGGETGIVEVRGTLDASNDAPGETGGSIEVTGERIALREAVLDASGDAGGGEVLVGGDFQGQGEVRTSDIAFVDPDSTIRADALSSGDGGKVIVWADYTTGFHGEIGARGGEAGGDGGLVEVSGKQYLFFHGDVDTSAPQGDMGQLLLDPVDITIANGVGDGDVVGAPDGTTTFAGDPSGITGSVLFADTSPTTIFESELEGLSASTNILLQATNSIVMQDLSDNLLALPTTAGGTVAFTGTGSFSMDASDTIRTSGASLSITGGSLTLGNLTTQGGNIGLNATGTSSTTIRSIDAGTGNVTLLMGGSVLDDGNTATRITGNTLLIGANAAGASIGSALAPIGTNLTGALSASANVGSGSIFFSEANGLLLGNVNGGTTKTVGLTAEAGAITLSPGTLVSGSSLTLTAQEAGAAMGTLAAPLRTNVVGPVHATTNNGNIFLSSAFPVGGGASSNAFTVGAINAGTGSVTLTANTGAPTALQGSIVDDGNAATRIQAAALTLNAAQSGANVGTPALPIQTNLTGALNVSAATGTGSVAVSEQNGLVVGSVNAGAKNVLLTAEAGSITDDAQLATTIVGNNLTLNANAAGAAIGTAPAPIRITLTGAVNAFTTNGTGGIFVTETNAMNIGTIDAGSASVNLAATGAILDDGNTVTFVAGNGLSLTSTGAGSAIGTSALPVVTQDIGNLTAQAIGGIFVRQTQGGDLTLGTLTSSGQAGVITGGGTPGISGGVTIRNDTGLLLVNGPISTFAGTLLNNNTPIANAGYTLPGAVTLDSPVGIEFGVGISSLTVGGNINLNTNVTMSDPPVLASIFRRPGPGDTAADLSLVSNNGFIDVGAGQVLSVPGTLTLSAPNGTPAGGPTIGGDPQFPFVPGSVTVGDVNALDIVVNAQQGAVRLRGPRTLYQQDGTVVGDSGVDWVANSIAINIGGAGLLTQGSGPDPTFSTPDGGAIANTPAGSRFGPPFVTTPLTPASFVGAGDPGTPTANAILDFRGTGGSLAGTPDAVAPVPYPIAKDNGQLALLNAEAAALNPVWGMELLAYLRCSPAAGEDADDVPLACLGYDVQRQVRAPLAGPEAAAARADYRELLAVREALREDLGRAYDAYRAQAPDAEPNGADFRRFVEEDAAHGEASNALQSLRRLLDSLDAMLGPERASGVFESWERDLLLDFTPGNMTPEVLYEATGAGSARVQTAGEDTAENADNG